MSKLTILFFVLLVFMTSQAQNQTINGNLHLTAVGKRAIRIEKIGDAENPLEFGGTVRAREIKVEITGGTNHIFNPHYNLKPLSEVESFIQLKTNANRRT